MTQSETVLIPVPLIAPFGVPMTAEGVQEVWNVFVKPIQDSGIPPSIEDRMLMAVLRSVYHGMTEKEKGVANDTE